MEGLQIRDVCKSYQDKMILKNVSFEIEPNEIVALLGPSGCGKSTLLNVIAGLETPDQGHISWAGQSLQGVAPHQRGFGLMFQDFALFPHMNVFDNVAFGLRMKQMPTQAVRERVHHVLDLVGLTGFEKRDIHALSGGESQRVALARSLAPEPGFLMLDEPLGSLDRNLRERLANDLRSVLRLTRQTALYVTHDHEEAFTLADRIVIMNAGQIEQAGSPQEIFHHPASVFTARFLGLNNILPGIAHQTPDGPYADTAIGKIPLPRPAQGNITILLRPDAIRVNQPGLFELQGNLKTCTFRGLTCRAVIRFGETELLFELPPHANLPAEGNPIRIGFTPSEAIQILD